MNKERKIFFITKCILVYFDQEFKKNLQAKK